MGCSPSGESETVGRVAEQSAQSVPSAPLSKDVQTAIYTHHPTQDVSLDIIKPTPEKSLHRGIILIHGGGWVGGSRGDMEDIGRYLAGKGFLTASVDYRLAPRNVWPAQLDDVQTAVRYIRTHAKDLEISPDKIGAAGISAGGHLSLFLGAVDTRLDGEYHGVSSRVQAVCSISGLHDLNLPLTHLGERYRIVQMLTSEDGSVDKKTRAAASPLTFVDAKTAPTLFIQGNEDPLVPPDQTTEAEKRLKELGVRTTVQFVDGMGHGLTPKVPLQARALDQLAFWMYKYLR